MTTTTMMTTTTDTTLHATAAPQIRHAGEAHVRGKIRRVWRPRFLELWDNGLVRYYEILSSSSSPSSSHHHHHHHRHQKVAKYTLAIFHARILDVTTFRDMHVGLPASCFGFVFRGQRLVHLEEDMEDSGEVREQRDFLCAVSSLEEAQMWVVALQWAASQHSHVSSARPLQYGVISTNNLTSTLGQLSLIEPWWNKDGSTPSPRQQQHAHTPRIVSRVQSTPTAPVTDPMPPRHRPQQTLDDDDMLGVQILESCNSSVDSSSAPPPAAAAAAAKTPPSPTTTRSAAQRPKTQQNTLLASSTTSIQPTEFSPPQTGSASMVVQPSFGSSPFRTRRRPTAQQKLVVVSKVVHYRLVRLQWQRFDVAFEIHVVLLKHSRQQQQQQQLQRAEQWSVLRTASDLQQLVTQLSQELGPAVVDQALGGRRQRQAVASLPRLGGTNWNNKSAAFSSSSSTWSSPAVLRQVDKMVRSLVLNADVVNAAALKSFLGFGSSRSPPAVRALSLRFLLPHDNKSILHTRQPVLVRDNVDQFVKDWLQERSSISKSTLDETSLIMLSKTTGNSLGWWCWAAALPLVATHWWQGYIPSLTIRMDYLLLSWAGAAYVGSQWKQDESKPKRPRAVSVPPAAKPGTKVVDVSESSSLLESTRNDDEVATSNVLRDYSDRADEESDEDMSEAGPASELSGSTQYLSSPIPKYPANDGSSCWSQPEADIFYVRGATYLDDRIKIPSGPAPLTCRGVDVWMADTAERHIARHPSVLGGKLGDEDTFLVNFLLPFGNLVAYFSIPPLDHFPPKLRTVWTKFREGDQEYRDKRLKLLPVVAEGPWIVKAAVGPGKSPALLGKVIPLQYFFRDGTSERKGVYEVDVIITASSIAKGILSVVKGHTKAVSIAFAFIIEGTGDDELPENVLCCFQMHKLHLEDCPILPACRLDEEETD